MAVLAAVEDAIVREMISGAEQKLRLTGIYFRPGMLSVDCVDESTVKWLKEKAPQLQKWVGTDMKACVGDEIPKARVITVFFPRSKDLINQPAVFSDIPK